MGYFVYQTFCLVNYRSYIGQTSYDVSTGYIGSGRRFLKAVKAYGKDMFIRHNIASGLTKKQADDLEIELILRYDAVKSKNFYNVRSGGSRGLHGDETKKLISQKAKARVIVYDDSEKRRRSVAIMGTNNPNSGGLTPLKKARTRWGALRKLFSKAPIVSEDLKMMHDFYNITPKMAEMNKEQLIEHLKFRFAFLEEELNEGNDCILQGDADGVVDSLIDLVVVAVGTLDLYGVDFKKAWYAVLQANMTKTVGIKEGRSNPFGFPDLVKPEGWVAPVHDDNTGLLENAFA